MRYAQISGGMVRWIFEADRLPDWPPDSAGNPVQIEDITLLPEVEEAWLYDGETYTAPTNEGDPEIPAASPAAAQATLTELAENQLIIMQALADLYEGGLTTNG
jgi:hypothetical protein